MAAPSASLTGRAELRPLVPGVPLALAAFTLGAVTIAYLASGRVGGGDLAVVVLASCLAWPTAAAVLLDRRPGHPLGAVLCLPALVPLVGAFAAVPDAGPRPLPSEALAGGSLPAVVLTCVALVALPLHMSTLGAPGPAGDRPSGIGSTALVAGGLGATVAVSAIDLVPIVGGACLLAVVIAAHVRVISAWRRRSGPQRDLLGWYLLGNAVLGPTALGLAFVVIDGAPAVAFYALAASLAAAPAGLTVLLLASSPPALDRALARGAAFVVALAALVSLYLAAVAGLAATGLPEGPVGAAVLTGTAALIAVPAWVRCRSFVEDLVFGGGRSPEAVLREMRRGLGDTHPEGPLTAVTDWVATALRSPAAQVHASGLVPRAHQAGSLTVPLRVGGADLGCLELAPRATGERYGRRDLDLVEHLAVPVALVAQAVAASQALARSEQRVIEERARERRRVLDDLHDGLGPALAGVGLQLSAARRRLAETADQDARASDGLVLLDAAGDAVRDARTALRQLARELAPGAASVAGHRSLAGSVAELVDGWSVAGHEIGLDVRLEACEVPEAASEAVELAAYRILGEAVTNVVRHARASRCTVRVSPRACPDGALELLVRVADDGRGCAFDTWNGPGVGLRSMRARAEELGGRLTMDDAPDGGTVLTAHLPLRGRT